MKLVIAWLRGIVRFLSARRYGKIVLTREECVSIVEAILGGSEDEVEY